MLNNLIVMGRLTKAPELRYTQSQVPVATFTLAVDQDYAQQGQERKTDFIPVVAWRNSAEFAAKYFKKGSMIVVVGRLQMRDWTDKDGNKRTAAEVVADRLYFGEAKPKETDAPAAPPESRFQELNDCDDGDLPF